MSYDAPLDERLAGMITRVCNQVVRQRTSCVHTGNDGVWYLVQAPGSAGSAVTWSPRPGTEAHSVIDMFTALRAYVAAPVPLRHAALQTLYREAYAAHAALGLFDQARSKQWDESCLPNERWNISSPPAVGVLAVTPDRRTTRSDVSR